MKISRRDFLSTVTGSAATLLSFRFTASDRPGLRPKREPDCALLDLKSHCVLRESLHGYQAALSDEHNYLPDAISDSRCRCGIMIVPGLGPMEPTIAQTLSELLKAGTHLLLGIRRGIPERGGICCPPESAASLFRPYGRAACCPMVKKSY